MNILIELGHPAHVHFFRQSISSLRERGHRLRIVTRAKEITNDLLDRLAIPYECLSSPTRGGTAGLAFELGRRWTKIARILRRDRIDVAASISGISTSVPARLCGIPNIVFTDTEDAGLSNRIAFPFADVIFTPRFFLRDLGVRHRRYRGLQELAYLRDFDFAAARRVREKLGLPERYVIVRTIANEALHDRDLRGVSRERLERLIARLEGAGQVFITSASALPDSLARYRLQTPIEDVHAVLAGAQLFIGESPTMAVEASLLGTPAWLVSGRVNRLGNMLGLSREENLLRCFLDWDLAEQALPRASDLSVLRHDWERRAELFRRGAEDLPALIEGAIVSAVTAKAAAP